MICAMHMYIPYLTIYPFLQNTNVNDHADSILLNIKFICYLLKYFEMTMMWYALHTRLGMQCMLHMY